jgi:deoxyguanosine kinase
MLAATAPVPDLVIYLQAKPDVLRSRLSMKNHPDERDIAPEYLATVAQAYEHYFFRYSASNLLVVDTSEMDFVARSGDLQELLTRLRQPVKGTQYYLPLGPG